MKRNGTSLIETMIAVSASSLLFLLSIGILHQTMRLSSRAKERTDFQQSNRRLAMHFREDVHLATKTSLAEDGSLILVLTDSESITYRTMGGAQSAVIREVKKSNDKIHQQDVFRVLDAAESKFTIDDQLDRVILEIKTSIPGEVDLKRMEMRVSATANRWQKVLSSRVGAP